MKTLNLTVAAACLFAGIAPFAYADNHGDVLVDIRARAEFVEQEGKEDAEMTSVRSLLGWRSPQSGGFTFLAEIENAFIISDDGYNNGLNGQTQYGKISNTEFTELQRLQLTYAFNDQFNVTAGRQYLNFDDKRFVGSPGASQDKVSHDAVAFNYSDGAFQADYVYHFRSNRGPGDRNEWEGDSHLFRAQYGVNEWVNLTGFAYFIDLDGSAASRSNFTYGGWLRGGHDFGDAELSYAAMVAQQSDYGDNTADFDLTYIVTDVSLEYGAFTFAAGWDVLEGDGTNRIVNPLGANHGVLGYADVFTGGGRQGTVDGLEDINFGVEYAIEPQGSFFGEIEFGVRRHEFSAESDGDDLGSEWDSWVTFALPHNLSLTFDYQDFEGTDDPVSPGDRQRLWTVLTYKR
ncbi:hypothetical protein [Maricaulis sp.]|uniref:hypothetical protein n=1 Tax=Maricaulis sp. TaxID=1486257 RepID=UPI0026394DF8|nr:hypothetical protein [Maricaulis sp.]